MLDYGTDQIDAMVAELKKLRRKEKNLRQHLKSLVEVVSTGLRNIDAAMKLPSTEERGRVIAAASDAMEMEKDRARFFALGIDYRTGKKREAAGERTKA